MDVVRENVKPKSLTAPVSLWGIDDGVIEKLSIDPSESCYWGVWIIEIETDPVSGSVCVVFPDFDYILRLSLIPHNTPRVRDTGRDMILHQHARPGDQVL